MFGFGKKKNVVEKIVDKARTVIVRQRDQHLNRANELDGIIRQHLDALKYHRTAYEEMNEVLYRMDNPPIERAAHGFQTDAEAELFAADMGDGFEDEIAASLDNIANGEERLASEPFRASETFRFEPGFAYRVGENPNEFRVPSDTLAKMETAAAETAANLPPPIPPAMPANIDRVSLVVKTKPRAKRKSKDRMRMPPKHAQGLR